MCEPVVLHGREIDAGQRLEDLQRSWTLYCEERITRAGIHGHGIAGLLDVLRDVRVIQGDVRGVHDEEKMRRGEAIDQQVVYERAGWRQQAGVLCLAGLQLRGV